MGRKEDLGQIREIRERRKGEKKNKLIAKDNPQMADWAEALGWTD